MTIITGELFDKIERLRLVGLRDVLINGVRGTDRGEESGYDTGYYHGVRTMISRILEDLQNETKDFFEYVKALESEDESIVV